MVLFYDEPLNNLDKYSSDYIIEILQDLHDNDVQLLIVTHDSYLLEKLKCKLLRYVRMCLNVEKLQNIFCFNFFYSTLIHDQILIQSTTSTRDSGFYEFLLPKYPSYQNINIKVVAVGTGQAIKNAENCDADLLIVHDYQKINFMK